MKLITTIVVLLAGIVTAQAQGQNGRYCFISREGAQNCGFATKAQCDKARKGLTADVCTVNPQYRGRR